MIFYRKFPYSLPGFTGGEITDVPRCYPIKIFISKIINNERKTNCFNDLKSYREFNILMSEHQ